MTPSFSFDRRFKLRRLSEVAARLRAARKQDLEETKAEDNSLLRMRG